MRSFGLHVREVFVELPELCHGGSEDHYLTAGVQRTLFLSHLHDGWDSLCREDNLIIDIELLGAQGQQLFLPNSL